MMMWRIGRRLCLLLGCLGIVASPAVVGHSKQDNRITWVIPDYPPVYIFDGPLAGQGEGDRILEWFRKALPDYHHRIVQGSMARIMEILRDPRENICTPAMAALPMLEDTLLPGGLVTVVLPLRAITLGKPHASFAIQEDRMLLADTLASGAVVGLVKGRHYRDLQPLLEPLFDSEQVLQMSQDNTISSLYRMLVAGRIDILIDHGFVLPFLQALEPESVEADALRLWTIAEATQTMPAGPMCRDNAWGQAIIERLNREVASAGFREMMVENRRRHLPPQEWAEHQALMETSGAQ